MNANATLGELRHEQCRYGTLNPGFQYDGSGQHPILVPICNWMPNQAYPPALRRAWGGSIEYERDCALCDAYSPLQARKERSHD